MIVFQALLLVGGGLCAAAGLHRMAISGTPASFHGRALLLSGAALITFAALPTLPGLRAGSVLWYGLLIGIGAGFTAWAHQATDLLPKARSRRWALMIGLAGLGLILLGWALYGQPNLRPASPDLLGRLGALMAVVMGVDLVGYGLWMLQQRDGVRPREPMAVAAASLAFVLSILWALAVASLIALLFVLLATAVAVTLLLRPREAADLPMIGMLSVASLGKAVVGLGLALNAATLMAVGAFFAFGSFTLVLREMAKRGKTWRDFVRS